MRTRLGMFLLAGLLAVTSGYAQKKNFSYKFYGQVRGDLFYNSRANSEIVDGLFHLYPKDISPDADGNDLNATCCIPAWGLMWQDRVLAKLRQPLNWKWISVVREVTLP